MDPFERLPPVAKEQGQITFLAFRDEHTLISGKRGRKPTIWDLHTGQRVQQLAQRADFVRFVGVRHGRVRVFPVAEHAQPLKVRLLTRDLLRVLMQDGASPAAALHRLNRALIDHPTASRFCTVALATIARTKDQMRLRLCLAGHPEPVLLRRDGTTSLVDYGDRGVPNVYLAAPLTSPGTWNAARFHNKQYDALVKQYVAALDLPTQKKIASQIETLLLNETPIVIPYWIDGLTASTPNVGGLNPTSIAQLYLNAAYKS